MPSKREPCWRCNSVFHWAKDSSEMQTTSGYQIGVSRGHDTVSSMATKIKQKILVTAYICREIQVHCIRFLTIHYRFFRVTKTLYIASSDSYWMLLYLNFSKNSSLTIFLKWDRSFKVWSIAVVPVKAHDSIYNVELFFRSHDTDIYTSTCKVKPLSKSWSR